MFKPLTSAETIGNTYAVWASDPQRVVFRTVAGMWLIDPNGGRPQPIAGTSVSDIPTSVSPDGRTLAFIRQAGGAGDLFTMSLDGTAEPRPLVTTHGYDGGGQFSPDGRLMAYVSNKSGQFEVYVRPYPAPEREDQVSTQGGTHAKWNPNGKELFYRSGNRMMAVDVSMREGDIVLSQPRVLFEQRYAFGGAQTVANYDVSPDGQRFVMVKDDSASGRMNVVLNWTEELKIRVPLN
jgi:Tol biopolymer transport system component